MKSIKPGRGPSMMGGVMSIFVGLFGIIWIFAAVSMGAPIFFPLFGVGFVIMAGVQAAYNFKNATSENRYSVYDITDGQEEADPLNERFGMQNQQQMPKEPAHGRAEYRFCPYCGRALREGDVYCSGCGRRL